MSRNPNWWKSWWLWNSQCFHSTASIKVPPKIKGKKVRNAVWWLEPLNLKRKVVLLDSDPRFGRGDTAWCVPPGRRGAARVLGSYQYLFKKWNVEHLLDSHSDFFSWLFFSIRRWYIRGQLCLHRQKERGFEGNTDEGELCRRAQSTLQSANSRALAIIYCSPCDELWTRGSFQKTMWSNLWFWGGSGTADPQSSHWPLGLKASTLRSSYGSPSAYALLIFLTIFSCWIWREVIPAVLVTLLFLVWFCWSGKWIGAFLSTKDKMIYGSNVSLWSSLNAVMWFILSTCCGWIISNHIKRCYGTVELWNALGWKGP